MELRNYFSLFCLHQETQLIFIYLPITSHILGAFVNSQVQGHREVCENAFKIVRCWLKELMRIIRDSAAAQTITHMPLPGN